MQGGRPFDKAWLHRAAPIAVAVIGLLVVRVYVIQVVELVRLRAWREELASQNAELERQVADLSFELERRGTDAWVVEQLHAMGLVGPDEVRVRAVPVTAVALPSATPTPLPDGVAERRGEALFRNEIWEAWKDLLFGRQGPEIQALPPTPEQ
ncbi:MAG: hypothetical protein ACP5G7_00050 [Anaerolineae bacterium]